MLTLDEITTRANKLQISPMVVIREFVQLLFLNHLSRSDQNGHFYFKGGTAIRFIYKGIRFSEDLDFTVIDLDPDKTTPVVEKVTRDINQEINTVIKPLKTLAGKSFRLFVNTPLHPQPIPIKIDLSFRESVLQPSKSVIVSDYPLVFTQLTYHYYSAEILAEKVRALMHRHKSRDLYDLWYLLSMQTEFDETLINQKFEFYHETYSKSDFLAKIKAFPQDKFIADLKPFLGKTDRDHLPTLYPVIQDYLSQKLS